MWTSVNEWCVEYMVMRRQFKAESAKNLKIRHTVFLFLPLSSLLISVSQLHSLPELMCWCDLYADTQVTSWSKLNTSCSVWILMCCSKVYFVRKPALQTEQQNGFTPEWVLVCRTKEIFNLNVVLQTEQLKSLSPLLILLCFTRSDPRLSEEIKDLFTGCDSKRWSGSCSTKSRSSSGFSSLSSNFTETELIVISASLCFSFICKGFWSSWFCCSGGNLGLETNSCWTSAENRDTETVFLSPNSINYSFKINDCFWEKRSYFVTSS